MRVTANRLAVQPFDLEAVFVASTLPRSQCPVVVFGSQEQATVRSKRYWGPGRTANRGPKIESMTAHASLPIRALAPLKGTRRNDGAAALIVDNLSNVDVLAKRTLPLRTG